MELRGLTAVVTGASSGVGRAIALALAREGAALCLLGRRAETLAMVANEARGASAPPRCFTVDLSSEAEIAGIAARLRSEIERVDILVHSAGAISIARIEEAAAADLDRQYAVNLRAPYALTRALLPMMEADRGQIVFVNSSTALKPAANNVPYAATKAALRALADGLREDVNGRGIRVTSVYPGRTATPMQAAVHAAEGRRYAPESLLQPEDVASVVVRVLTLPFTAEVTDVSIRPMRKLEQR